MLNHCRDIGFLSRVLCENYEKKKTSLKCDANAMRNYFTAIFIQPNLGRDAPSNLLVWENYENAMRKSTGASPKLPKYSLNLTRVQRWHTKHTFGMRKLWECYENAMRNILVPDHVQSNPESSLRLQCTWQSHYLEAIFTIVVPFWGGSFFDCFLNDFLSCEAWK